jgi:phage/plasmid primase-like uncharacterized protein
MLRTQRGLEGALLDEVDASQVKAGRKAAQDAAGAVRGVAELPDFAASDA